MKDRNPYKSPREQGTTKDSNDRVQSAISPTSRKLLRSTSLAIFFVATVALLTGAVSLVQFYFGIVTMMSGQANWSVGNKVATALKLVMAPGYFAAAFFMWRYARAIRSTARADSCSLDSMFVLQRNVWFTCAAIFALLILGIVCAFLAQILAPDDYYFPSAK